MFAPGPMTSDEFVTWLRGFFDINQPSELTYSQVRRLKHQLEQVREPLIPEVERFDTEPSPQSLTVLRSLDGDVSAAPYQETGG